MRENDKPLVNPVAVLREEFDDWAVLFNPDTAEAVGLNPTGVLIWKHMDGTRDLSQLAETVRGHYRSIPDGLADDIVAFVEELERKGFVGFQVG